MPEEPLEIAVPHGADPRKDRGCVERFTRVIMLIYMSGTGKGVIDDKKLRTWEQIEGLNDNMRSMPWCKGDWSFCHFLHIHARYR